MRLLKALWAVVSVLAVTGMVIGLAGYAHENARNVPPWAGDVLLWSAVAFGGLMALAAGAWAWDELS